MSSRPLPIFIDAIEVHRNPLVWSEVSRSEAIRVESRGMAVVVIHGQSGSATRFEEGSQVWFSQGPYDYSRLRYFVFRGGGQVGSAHSSGGGGTAKRSSGSGKQNASEELEPELDQEPYIDEDESSPKPEPRSTPPKTGEDPVLGGIKVQFTDPLNHPMEGLHAILLREGDKVWEGDLKLGLLSKEGLEFGSIEAQLTRKGHSFTLPIGWQSAPIALQPYPLWPVEEKKK